MNLKLHVWRQPGPNAAGRLVTYEAGDVDPDMSFLEMLDVVNEALIDRGEEPIAFDHDCREGICGSCGVMIDGVAHGDTKTTATCQLHMRHFADGDEITIEPWRSTGFPVLRDLVVDRSAFDRIIAAGGYISVNTGSAPDANEILVPKINADAAFEAATCIGCGACVAQCPNGAAHLFTGAKGRPPGSPAPGSARAPGPRRIHGGPNGGRGLRQLHQPPGVRSGLPEGHPDRRHWPPQSGLPAGSALEEGRRQVGPGGCYPWVMRPEVDPRGLDDTDPEVRERRIEIYRAMSPARKLELVNDAIRTNRALLWAGLSYRYPHESEKRRERRLLGIVVGEELAVEAYGPLEDFE